MKKDRCFIVVIYNGQLYIERLINAVFLHEPDADIIFVDNASSDNSLSLIPTVPQVILLQQQENLGFGRANNIGIKYALDHGYQHIFLLNQDAYLTEPIFDKMIACRQRDPLIGVISPIQLNDNGTGLEYFFERFMVEQGVLGKILLNQFQQKNVDVYDADFAQAALWYIPADVFERVGGFDPIFSHYGEDNNFIQRIKYAGLKLVVHAGIRACHTGSPDSASRHKSRNFNSYDVRRRKSEYLSRFTDITRTISNTEMNQEAFRFFIRFLKAVSLFKFGQAKGIFQLVNFILTTKKSILKSRDANVQGGRLYLD